MKRINLLSEDTTNKIAAGEVVERPASVVKELVENSIDAGAKNITVEIEDGGQKSIKITDDGIGIHPEDIEKAFLAHATSKILNIDDIYEISTLGFRGEALASIASISKTKLKSRREDLDFGKEIYFIGGEKQYIKEIGCSKGTIIEIDDIFFNVPARQKFLKSSQRETAIISDLVLRLAICNKHISFKYINNGRMIFNTKACENLKDTIRVLYGKEAYNNVISFENHSDIASIHGYIGNSELSRGSRNKQSIFVNKRLINNKLMTTAVENAFKSFITVNKFPFFILFLEIYPEYIDVNVHPTKSEIKFREEREIFKLVFDGVHKALRESLKNSFNIDFNEKSLEKVSHSSNKNSPDLINDSMEQIPIDLKTHHEDKFLKDLFVSENNCIDKKTYSYGKGNIKDTDIIKEPVDTNEHIKDYMQSKENFKLSNLDLTENNKVCMHNDSKLQNEKVDEKLLEAKFAPLKIIGQFNNTYILCEANTELYIIDQHAAHEKILFEKYREYIAKGNISSQILLTPLVKELHPDEFVLFHENEEVFKKAGFNIEIFGDNTVSIREVPMFLGKPNVDILFTEIIQNLKNMGSGSNEEVKYDSIATLSCKAAVKAHDKLSVEEMEHLIDDLRFIDEPFTCPHGRPTIIKISLKELEKKFKRIN